jgi:MoaE-MoaD fusion protein
MKVKVLFFAHHRRTTNLAETDFNAPDGSSVQVVSGLIALQFKLELKGSMIAVNDAYASPEQILKEGDILAFIPPVSGGSETLNSSDDVFLVTEKPLNLEQLHLPLTKAEWGGQAMFTGSTRSPNKGEIIVHLEYEAYPAFCLAEMKRIAFESRAKFELGRIVMAHRIGTVLPAEVSIFIGAASAHRRACLEAVPWMLDEAKLRLPVWKLEVTSSGERWVEGSTAAPTL